MTAAPIALDEIILRPYQSDAFTRARECYRRGKKAVLLVAPTGAGKTIMGAFVARSHLDRKGPESMTLVIVPRIELAEQWRRTFERIGLRVGLDLDAADQIALIGQTPQVIVATVQALLARKAFPRASLIIADEAHHYVSSEWFAIVAPHLERGAKVLGLTATPCRSDGTALGHLFDALVTVASIRELVGLGYLTPCDVIAPPMPERKKGDAQTVVLAADPVAAYLEHGRDAAGELRRAIFFARTVKHAHDLVVQLSAAGVATDSIDCHLGERVRADRIRRFRDREIVALVNVSILTEGFDDPSVEVIVLARRVGHVGLYLQIVGRGLRPSPDTGKTRALLLDLGGSRWEHGAPDEERDYSLEGEAITRKIAKVRKCISCGAKIRKVDLRAEKCLTCGEPLGNSIVVVVEPEPLTLVSPTAQQQGAMSPTNVLADLIRKGRARQYADGWASHQFRQRFERWPSFQERRAATAAVGAA